MENLVTWVSIIGISQFLSAIIIHTTDNESLQNKKMFDVSAHLMILIASGMFLWVIYGFIKSDPVIIGTNAAGFALNITY